jgi:hypothetical protein
MQTGVCLMDADKDTKKKINMLEALHYTVPTDNQNCLRKASYMQGQSSSDRDIILTKDFRKDWEKYSGMNKDIFKDSSL